MAVKSLAFMNRDREYLSYQLWTPALARGISCVILTTESVPLPHNIFYFKVWSFYFIIDQILEVLLAGIVSHNTNTASKLADLAALIERSHMTSVYIKGYACKEKP